MLSWAGKHTLLRAPFRRMSHLRTRLVVLALSHEFTAGRYDSTCGEMWGPSSTYQTQKQHSCGLT